MNTASESAMTGQRVLISGGGSGMGRATAHLLCRRGARVLIFGRREESLRQTAAAAQTMSGSIDWVTADHTRHDDVKRVFAKVDSVLGGLDVLVNNAAMGAGSVVDTDADKIATILDTNITGAVMCAKYALDRMLPAGRGDIVNVGSMSAEIKDHNSDLYVATKSAIRGFSASLRRKVSAQGLRVILIEPGQTGTEMPDMDDEEQQRQQEEQKLLTADDIAQSILFCLTQPRRVATVMVQLRPLKQPI